MRPLTPLVPFLRPYRRAFLGGALSIALGSVIGSLSPLVVKRAVDALRTGTAVRGIAPYAAVLDGLALLQAVFRYFQRRVVYDASRRIETDLRDALFARLVVQPPAWFDDFPTGDVMSRFINDLGAVRMALGPGFVFGVSTVVTLAMALGFMAWIDAPLTVWAMLPLPFVTLTVQRLGRRLHRRSEEAQAALADVTTAVQENLAGVRVVRAYAREDVQKEAFRGTSEAYVAANLRLARLQALLSPLLGFLLGSSLLLLLWIGGRRVAAGELTLGDFVAFTLYLGMVAWPLIAFGWITNLWQRAAASMGRLNRILLSTPAIDDRRADPAARPVAGALEVRDVTFRYRTRRAPVLDGLSLDVPAGTTLGVTGPTGGGKSTLVGLLARLWEPDEGEIRLDGRPLAEYSLHALRGAFGFAPQEPFLFSETLRANLALGVDGDQPEVEEAARIAGLAEDVADFPAVYETWIGERGITLSGGQKQRAALARAILADPLVLVLDDAFSSVDTETEERILSRLREFMAERTTILVSHRVSTLRGADRVVVLDGGRIVESGSHAELVAAGGWYAALERRQRLEAEVERA